MTPSLAEAALEVRRTREEVERVTRKVERVIERLARARGE
jgi:hypothetical protein